MKRALFFIFFVSFMLALPGLAKRPTAGFKVIKMRLNIPFRAEWEIGEISGPVRDILSQPYHYLGQGSQCYAFESYDKKYVVKFFRFARASRKYRLVRDCLFNRKKKKYSENKVFRLFNACKIAYNHAAEETGLIYLHLNQTTLALPILHCTDKIGRQYDFPLDKYRFVVQEKADPFLETLLKARNDPVLMKKKINDLIALLVSRASKCILNTDPNLHRNFGFLPDRAIELDFGNYTYRPALSDPVVRHREIERYAARLRRILQKNAPEWVSYLDERMEEVP